MASGLAPLEYSEALARVLALAPAAEPEIADVERCSGRVLAEAIVATAPLPSVDRSVMDGYAVRASSVRPETRLAVVGESRAGSVPEALLEGTTMRIFTGAALPAGADAVVMQEDARRDGDSVVFDRAVRLHEHVRRLGSDVAPGDRMIDAGTRLTAAHLSLLAALDLATVAVARAPRVAIVTTGDELRPAGSPARPGTIPESNGAALLALARDEGAVTARVAALPDDLARTSEALDRALAEFDVVLTVGGVSVGDHDWVPRALAGIGATTAFHKVALRPGKPLFVASRGRSVVLGLPGNPVSAQVTFRLFAAPLLRAWQGHASPEPPRARVVVAEAVPHDRGRLELVRARHDRASGMVVPLANQSSGSVRAMADADWLLWLAPDRGDVAAGEVLDALPLR